MTETRPIQHCVQFAEGRPETGPMQHGDDWPGVFIRGDDAMGIALAISVVLRAMNDLPPTRDLSVKLAADYLRDTYRLMLSCDQSHNTGDGGQ